LRNTNRIYVTVLGLEGDVDEIPDLLLVSYQTLASKNRAIAAFTKRSECLQVGGAEGSSRLSQQPLREL
jgi:hypothetical protein